MSQSSSPVEQLLGLLFVPLAVLAAIGLLARRLYRERKAVQAPQEAPASVELAPAEEWVPITDKDRAFPEQGFERHLRRLEAARRKAEQGGPQA
ncbi:hypothetical protein [Pseudomonas aeruginosa]|uniref:hypothetical protein n=1 Tax=Pseudomonas aeruginosa TaxID=287 RepID=UPI001AAF82FF|nr:hypothetical protein [Pseudomonas aeruginosa]MBO2834629.1 hypothetical protein [Pseudomonas aeruginosa]